MTLFCFSVISHLPLLSQLHLKNYKLSTYFQATQSWRKENMKVLRSIKQLFWSAFRVKKLNKNSLMDKMVLKLIFTVIAKSSSNMIRLKHTLSTRVKEKT